MIKTITVECQDCAGKGFIHSTELFRGKRVDIGLPCHTCHETGSVSFEWECCEHCGDPLCCEDCQPTTPEPASAPVVYNGGIVDAPGFDTPTFGRMLAKAQARGYYHITPVEDGTVRVETRRGGMYRVGPRACTCLGHAHFGYCQHRAACIWIMQVCGIDITREEIVGFTPQGQPVTKRERVAQVAAERAAA